MSCTRYRETALWDEISASHANVEKNVRKSYIRQLEYTHIKLQSGIRCCAATKRVENRGIHKVVSMKSETSSSSLASLLSLVKALKRDDARQSMSTSEREAKIANVIEKLAGFQPIPTIAAQAAPMTLSAEER